MRERHSYEGAQLSGLDHHLMTLVSLIRVLVESQSLGKMPAGKAAEDDLNVWDPAAHVADLDGVSGTQCQLGSCTVIAALWGGNQQKEDLSLLLLLLFLK